VASWTSASGVRHISRNEWAPKAGGFFAQCPKALDPFSQGQLEPAMQVALLAAEDLYPGAVAVVPTHASGPLSEGPCGPAIARSSYAVDLKLTPRTHKRSDSLSQGRVLVGSVNGHLQVYYVMH
jgi:hypothetical protein